jgi:hypothetical protein
MSAAPPPPGVTDDERRTIAEMMAKGTYASFNLATADFLLGGGGQGESLQRRER